MTATEPAMSYWPNPEALATQDEANVEADEQIFAEAEQEAEALADELRRRGFFVRRLPTGGRP